MYKALVTIEENFFIVNAPGHNVVKLFTWVVNDYLQ
jgi:hypothetical protein